MPIIVLFLTWFSGLFVFLFFSSLYSLSVYSLSKIVIYISVALFGFVIGRLITPKVKFSIECAPRYGVLNLIVLFVFTVLLLNSVLVIYEAISFGNVSNYFYYKRVEALSSKEGGGFLYGQFIAFSFVYTIIHLSYCFNNKEKIPVILVLSALMFVFIAASEGGRSVSFIYLLVIFFLALVTKRVSLIGSVKFGLIIVFIFAVSSYYMRVSEADKLAGNALGSIFNHLIIYLFGGIKAYDVFLNREISVFHSQLNSIFENTEQFQMPFVLIGEGVSTNVYSAFAIYEYYFGDIFSVLFIFVLFFLAGSLFSVKSNPVLISGFKAFFLSATFLMVFHDYFFALYPYVGRYFLLYLFLNGLLWRRVSA